MSIINRRDKPIWFRDNNDLSTFKIFTYMYIKGMYLLFTYYQTTV